MIVKNPKGSQDVSQIVKFLLEINAKQSIKNRMGLYYLAKSPAHFLAYCSLLRALKALMPTFRKPTSVVSITVPLDWPISMFEAILEKALRIDDVPDAVRHRFGIYVHLQARDLRKSGTDKAVIEKLAHRHLVVLVPAGTSLMPELDLVVDQEVEIDIGATRDLIALARLRKSGEVSETTAAVLRQQPPSQLTAIFRPDRPLPLSIARIQRRKLSSSAYDRDILTLDDVRGFGEAARWGQTLRRDIEQWKAGTLAWSEIDKGLLMIGAPGTGKTMFAQILANTCGLNFYPHSLPQWQKLGHMGDLLKGMTQAFQTARDNAPSLLFVDELDSVGDRKTFTGDNEHYQTEVLNALLELVDGSIGREGVIVAGATNYPGKIDQALLRSGRLERHIVFEHPGEEGRAEILCFYLPDLPKAGVADFAKRLNRWSPADIERLARTVRRTARGHGRPVTISDLIAEFPEKKPLSEDDLGRISIHEAGHAVMAITLGLELKRVSISRYIDPLDRSLWLGVTTTASTPREIRTKKEILNEINICLAGAVAEELFFGERTTFAAGEAEGDLYTATELAFSLITRFGFGDRLTLIPGQVLKDLVGDMHLRTEVDNLLHKQYELVSISLQQLKPQVLAVAEALREQGELSGQQATEIFARPANGFDGAISA
jgi:cell division protease FtsH